MDRVRAFLRRLTALPRRAQAALALAVVLTVVAVLLVVSPGGNDRGDAAGDDTDGDVSMTSTTLYTGGVDVEAPDGWLTIPIPDLGFGIAVPPGWEAVVLSPDGLATLADASPVVPGFVDSAHAAAGRRSVLYAAGVDDADAVSDLEVRAAPETGVTDVDTLAAYAEDVAAEAGRTDPQVEVVDGAALPTVRMRFQVGAEDQVAEATETLVLGDDGLVWSVIVTSDDAELHHDLASAITDTLMFAG